ncbi:conjugal transfer protein TraD [Acidithiobacillus sp. VAN18-1]|uniref:Conjugal transfer protein TraD n=2 Tax=Igneacidithiobacillus copahuensis TaxID=2724909 RepID=A0AAE2YPX2_9PROT|nr:conjugal transfer protein TraD [Igneacidithiobacillus copahuensis]MBU2795375.1 conjugal transfer protein TraD [Acidithiobacillus sp. VAN18-2]
MERLAAQKQAALDKARAADAQLKKLRAEQDRMARISARKEHNRALFQAGILVEIAGALRLDQGTLLGGLLDMARRLEDDPAVAEKWKRAGDAEIARRDSEKRHKTEAI